MSSHKKTSIKDIARETDFSITTVSRVLNGKGEEYRISQKTEKLVQEAAKKLNYRANYAAANLKSGKSNTIALLIPSLSNPFFANMASEINKDLREAGYITILSESSENLRIEKDILDTLFTRNIEGLIIVPCSERYEHIVQLRNQGLPIICIDRYFENLDMPYVSTNNYEGAKMGTKHLIDNGHRKIAGIQGVLKSIPNQKRVLGFTDALREAGIDSTDISGNDFSVQNGYLETKLLLQKKEKPTAIFAFSNTIALGCLKALKEADLTIPDDISLITFDDHPYLEHLSTPLSCITQPESDIASLAIRFLFALLENDDLKTGQVLLKPELKVRSSVCRINR